MKKISQFHEGDDAIVTRISASNARQRLYGVFGIIRGARITIFLVAGNRMILRIGATKLALSAEAANEIFAKKAPASAYFAHAPYMDEENTIHPHPTGAIYENKILHHRPCRQSQLRKDHAV